MARSGLAARKRPKRPAPRRNRAVAVQFDKSVRAGVRRRIGRLSGSPGRTLAALAAVLLMACSPRFEWREVRSPEGYVVMLPGRAQTVSREVVLGSGQTVTMVMSSSGVGATLFAVGAARLGPEIARDPAARSAAVAYFQQALLRNVKGTGVARSTPPHGWPPADARRVLVTEAIEATGEAGSDGRKSRLAARFYVVDDQLFQLVALGAEGEIPPEALDTFFTSFRLTP